MSWVFAVVRRGHSIMGVVGDVLRENPEKRRGVALACHGPGR